jgi:acyl carrier protein
VEEKVKTLVLDAITDLNAELPENQHISAENETPLIGRSASLDSLGLVRLIVAVEEQIQDNLGVRLTLADERAMSQSSSPFRTLQTLQAYILQLLSERNDG